ncbi:hypothetical protein Droror1_Dr00025193 [Drosera rotundifolia]
MKTDEEWMNQARLVAIDYILNARSLLGFRLQTAYFTITYFDQFLSKQSIDSGKSWTIELLSVALLSLAAKLEECRLPSLTEFQVGEFMFENRIIQRMELLVLDALEWKASSVTPFAYFLYFINKFQADHQSPFSKGIVSRSINLILGIARGELSSPTMTLANSQRPLTTSSISLKRKRLTFDDTDH